jgi:hypothetical protein
MFRIREVPHVCEPSNHRFEPRYDEVPMEPTVKFGYRNSFDAPDIDEEAAAMRSLMVRSVYVKDVCIYCGKEVRRD